MEPENNHFDGGSNKEHTKGENMFENMLDKSVDNLGEFLENMFENMFENGSVKVIKLPNTKYILSKIMSAFSQPNTPDKKLLFSNSLSRGVLYNNTPDNMRMRISPFVCSLLYELVETNPEKVGTPKLPLQNLDYFKYLQKNNEYIVENFLYPAQVVIIFGSPACFKSLTNLKMALSIASGKQFLDFKTKQKGVLYFDSENNDQILKERLHKLNEGITKNIPFYICKSGLLINQNKKVQYEFIDELKKIVEEKNIKVVFFDTLHRFCYYDENSSDDLNLVYMEVFKPLQKMGVTVVFLHHTTKEGKMRGSGDLLGQVDVAYKVVRTKGTNVFKITNEKSRSGEIEDLKGKIEFEEDFISIESLNPLKVTQEEQSKFKQACDCIESIIFNENESEGWSANELKLRYEQDISISKSTFNRVIKHLKASFKIFSEHNRYYALRRGNHNTSNVSGHPSISYEEINMNEKLTKLIEAGDIMETKPGVYEKVI